MNDDELEIDEVETDEDEDIEDVLVEEGEEAIIERQRKLFVEELAKQRTAILSTPIPSNTPVAKVIEERVDQSFKAVLDTIDGKGDHPACMLIPYTTGTNEVIQEYLITQIRGEDDDVRSLDIGGELSDTFFELINT